MRLVQEVISISRGGFRVLVNGYCDCLNMLVAPTFVVRETPNLVQGL